MFKGSYWGVTRKARDSTNKRPVPYLEILDVTSAKFICREPVRQSTEALFMFKSDLLRHDPRA